MKLRSLFLFVVLLLTACGQTSSTPETPTPDPDPTPTPTPTPEPTPAIHGSLTVHVPGWSQVPPAFIEKATVLLGDGSRFRQPLDAKGDAHFVDAAIVGPQDITVVVVAKSDTPFVGVSTFLAMDQPELWLNDQEPVQTDFPPPPPKLATVSGKVTGVTRDHPVFIFAAGPGVSGGVAVNPDGTFRFDVLSAEPGKVDLIVREEDDSNYDDPQALRAGRLRDIPLSRDQVLDGLALTLDQPVDQSLSVTVNGFQPYAAQARVLLDFFEGQLGFFSTSATGTSPLSLRSLALSAPFDTTQRQLSTTVGDPSNLPAGRAFALKRIDQGPAASLTLLSAMIPSTPRLGTFAAPSTTPRAGLALRWSIDASANFGRLQVQPDASSGPNLSWSVIAPASVTSFTPFPLPAEVSPLSTLPAGKYSVAVKSSFRGDIHDYASLFTQQVPHTSNVEVRSTDVMGYVELQ